MIKPFNIETADQSTPALDAAIATQATIDLGDLRILRAALQTMYDTLHHGQPTCPDITQDVPTFLAHLDKIIDHAQPPEHHHLFVSGADEKWFQEGLVEIDGDAVVSRGEGGAFVEAWVWVTDEEAEIPVGQEGAK